MMIATHFASKWLLVAAIMAGSAAQPRAADNLNIVLIVVDDLGWNDVNYLPNQRSPYYTPNIEKLASQGMVFSNGYAACPVCSPTRASLVTGKSIASVKITAHIPGALNRSRVPKGAKVRPPEFPMQLPLEEITFAEVLKKAGYTTGYMGKWHLAGAGSVTKKNALGAVAPQFHPNHQGFDINIGGCAYGQPKSYFSPYKNKTIKDGPKGEYLTDRLAAEAVKFIEGNKDRKFLLYLNPYSVHAPHKAPAARIAEIKAKVNPKVTRNKRTLTYAAMVYSIDLLVGKVVDKLDELKLADNTLLIFTSDNGGLLDNAPLRDHKGTLYEGGIRVPYIVRWPGVVKPGSQSAEPIISYDLFPTLVSAAGLAKDIPAGVEGQNLAPIFRGQPFKRRRPLYWHYPHYHHGGMQSFDMGSTIRDGDWKFTHIYKTGKDYLFNLKTDPHEDKNLCTANPERADALKKKLFAMLKEVNANMPRRK